MADVDALHEAALEYLEACTAALDALTAAGAPDDRYVSHGPPAWECCPMLTVHVGGATIASTRVGTAALAPGHRIVLTGVLNQVVLTATILRCSPATPDGSPALAAAQTAFAAQTNADLWAIWNWVIARKHDGTLFGGECRELQIETASALAVEGLCAGWLIPVRVTVDGFTPAAT